MYKGAGQQGSSNQRTCNPTDRTNQNQPVIMLLRRLQARWQRTAITKASKEGKGKAIRIRLKALLLLLQGRRQRQRAEEGKAKARGWGLGCCQAAAAACRVKATNAASCYKRLRAARCKGGAVGRRACRAGCKQGYKARLAPTTQEQPPTEPTKAGCQPRCCWQRLLLLRCRCCMYARSQRQAACVQINQPTTTASKRHKRCQRRCQRAAEASGSRRHMAAAAEVVHIWRAAAAGRQQQV